MTQFRKARYLYSASVIAITAPLILTSPARALGIDAGAAVGIGIGSLSHWRNARLYGRTSTGLCLSVAVLLVARILRPCLPEEIPGATVLSSNAPVRLSDLLLSGVLISDSILSLPLLHSV